MPGHTFIKVSIPHNIQQQFKEMDWLSSSFPIQVGAGRYSWISLKCPYCGATIGLGAQKGKVDRNEHSAAITGFGACKDCKSLAPFQARLREDGTILFRQENGWVEQNVAKQGLLHVLVNFLTGGKK